MRTLPLLLELSSLFFISLALAHVVSGQPRRGNFPYQDPSLSISERVKDLLRRMTLEDKVAQLQCEIKPIGEVEPFVRKGIGGLAIQLRPFGAKEAAEKANALQKLAIEESRLGIPIIIHDEGLHGLVGKAATSFPQAIGLAATWNPDLMYEVATAIAKEARSRGIRQLLSPVINIARDVRWGRVEETYGEDPYLTARMGVAFCKALEENGVISTPKHFAANVGDGGRDSHPIHFSERLLREIYFPAFKACVQEASATSVMAAYNSLDGRPCSANPWLLTDVLRKEWGFKGFVVSDYGSVWGIKNHHHTAATEKEAAKAAVEAGLDIELPNVNFYGDPLLQAVKEGLVPESTIDTAVSRILAAKFRLGLFEHPYVDPEQAAAVNEAPEHRALALRSAREAIVLLKNDRGLLPLKKDLKSIAVIGPDADGQRLGGYSGFGMKIVTVLEGIKNKVSSTTIVRYAKGCELGEVALPPIPSRNLKPQGARVGEHGLRGEYFNNMSLSGEPALVRIDEQINFDWGVGSPDPSISPDHFSVRWTGKLIADTSGVYRISLTTDDGARMYLGGKLLIESWFDRAPSTDVTTVRLEAGREYDLRIEFYENEGGAFAALGWQAEEMEKEQVAAAASLAKSCEAAVIVAGLIEGEGRDRADLSLPGAQEELIKAVAETGVPTVVVLIGGSAVTMSSWIEKVPAILFAWYPGEEGGNAIADVLFGDYNPAGRLPITFPLAVGQVPLYYNLKPSGRGYDYVNLSGKPLFPFGHGLSYTRFEYSNLQINPKKARVGEEIQINVDIQNIGATSGEEVVQLYLRDPVASVTRPLKELKGFRRVTVEPNEKKTVTFVLTRDHLSFLDQDLKYVIEPGVLEVMVGSSSQDIRLTGSFEVTAK